MKQLKIFEGQEVSVITDKGEKLINLVHVAKCCGLTKDDRGYLRVRWEMVRKKLNLICGQGCDHKEEINYILEEIENADDRNSIFMSSWLSKRLAIECHSEKAMRFKNFLVSLDEAREKGELAATNDIPPEMVESFKMVGYMSQVMQKAMIGMQEFLQDSIKAKDHQIDTIADMVGLRAKNINQITKFLKNKLFNKYGRSISASDPKYVKAKNMIFKEFKVYRWEEIPVGKYNAVHAYIDEMI